MRFKLLIIVLQCGLSLYAQQSRVGNQQDVSGLTSEVNMCVRNYNEGVLLVRLRSNANKINALKKYRGEAEARQEQFKQDAINKEIIQNFNQFYTFSKVYFFYSENSKYILNKEFDKVSFVDENLNVDKSIKLSSDEQFLIAEFSSNKHKAGVHRSGSYMKKDETGVRMVDTYWGAPAIRFSALIIMNDRFEQLSKPVPRYVRTYESIPIIRRSKQAVVKRLVEKITQFMDVY